MSIIQDNPLKTPAAPSIHMICNHEQNDNDHVLSQYHGSTTQKAKRILLKFAYNYQIFKIGMCDDAHSNKKCLIKAIKTLMPHCKKDDLESYYTKKV